MTDDAAKRATVGDIRRRLHDRFPADRGWLCMDEVTPPVLERLESARRFDAIAISLWASHGQCIHGFEIKVTRADWRTELATPAKAGALMRWCDRYWLVCPPDITDGGDLPAGWGLIHATTDGLRQKRAAPTLTPVPRGADFWCCMLNRLHHRAPPEPAEIAAARQEGYERGLEFGKADRSFEGRSAENALRRLQEQVAEWEKDTGLQVSARWGHGRRVGEALRLLAESTPRELGDRLAQQAEGLREAAEVLERVAVDLRAPTADAPRHVEHRNDANA